MGTREDGRRREGRERALELEQRERPNTPSLLLLLLYRTRSRFEPRSNLQDSIPLSSIAFPSALSLSPNPTSFPAPPPPSSFLPNNSSSNSPRNPTTPSSHRSCRSERPRKLFRRNNTSSASNGSSQSSRRWMSSSSLSLSSFGLSPWKRKRRMEWDGRTYQLES